MIPFESGPSDPKKWGFYWCGVKKADFWAKRESAAMQRGQHKNLVFLVSSHICNKIFQKSYMIYLAIRIFI